MRLRWAWPHFARNSHSAERSARVSATIEVAMVRDGFVGIGDAVSIFVGPVN